jgi:hypothetical protein
MSMKPVSQRTLPSRSDAAATIVYRIMETLHLEYKCIFLPNSPDKKSELPAIEFVTPSVQLCGYSYSQLTELDMDPDLYAVQAATSEARQEFVA